MSRRRVVVVGGGLAGVAAACEAALRGAEVTLLERRPFLGGRAFSFALGEHEIDNGQHVFLGCCTGYRWLLRLLGTEGHTVLSRRLRVSVRSREGREGVLAAGRLPPPLSIAPSFATYPHLSLHEKARALRALTSLMAMSESTRVALDHVSFAEWLEAHGQGPGAIARFWDLLVLPTCNDRSSRVSTTLAAYVFREGLFRTRGGSAIGYARVGLTHLIEPAVGRFLAARGGRVRTGCEVLHADGGGVDLVDGTRIEADAVVAALPPERAPAIVGTALTMAVDVGSCPIVNVHLWLSQPIMSEPVIALVDSPAQWVFNRTLITGAAGPGQHLAISISGAHDEIQRDRAQLAQEMAAEIAVCLPAARDAEVLAAHVVKEPRATFAPGPGQHLRRPGPRTADPRLFLAGAWTNTGWPATMEGAVRSGIGAARLALGIVGPARDA